MAAYAARFETQGRIFEPERWSFDADEPDLSSARISATYLGVRVLGPVDVAEVVAAALA